MLQPVLHSVLQAILLSGGFTGVFQPPALLKFGNSAENEVGKFKFFAKFDKACYNG